jgi:hypothetical protein
MWCLFVIVQHFCFNPGHPNFRRTAHMYQTVVPDRFAAVARPALHACLLLGYLPLMAIYPLLTALASNGDYRLALTAPFAWLDPRFRSQKDQTAMGLLNTSVDLTLLAHRPSGDDILDKTRFFEQCGPAGLSTVRGQPPAASRGEPHGLASLRVRMLHDGSGTPYQLGRADIKFVRRGGIVSNVSQGGVYVLVDEAGRLQNEAIDLVGTRYQGTPTRAFGSRAVRFRSMMKRLLCAGAPNSPSLPTSS